MTHSALLDVSGKSGERPTRRCRVQRPNRTYVRHTLRRLLLSLLLVVFGLVKDPAAGGVVQVGDLDIRDIWIEPAAAGSSTRLHLYVISNTRENFYLLQATTPVSSGSRFLAEVGSGTYVQLESVLFPGESSFDSERQHTTIELTGLTSDLAPGERVPVTLRFNVGHPWTIDVPVRPAVGGSPERGGHGR
jgi:copper(I)-binding protein